MKFNIFNINNQNVSLEVSSSAKEKLEEYVKKYLKENIRVSLEVNKLIKTENTFKNSIPYLYEYFKDRDECIDCSFNYLSCKKNNKGYIKVLYYDDVDDCIKVKINACQVLETLKKYFGNFIICDIDPFDIFNDAFSLSKCVIQNQKKMITLAKYIAKFSKYLKDPSCFFSFDCLFSLNSNLSQSLIRLMAYKLVSSNHEVCYIDSSAFFSQLFSFKTDDKDIALNDYEKIKKCPYLFFEQIDSLPFIKNEDVDKFIIPLFEERKKKNLFTVCEIKNDKKFYSLFNKKLSSYFDLVTIKDLDLR